MKQKEIKTLMAETGEYPREVTINNDLDGFQKVMSLSFFVYCVN